MSKKLYLCIGGRMDGKRISLLECPPPPFIRFPLLESAAPIDLDAQLRDELIKEQHFERVVLRGPKTEYFVYVHNDGGQGDVVGRLIEGYQSPGKSE